MTYSGADFAAEFDVPRRTLDKLDVYAALLAEWQQRINLVGPSTISSTWERHFRDSAQLLALSPDFDATWLDIGAGAGFPGVVLALLGIKRIDLVESTTKKCCFLEAVVTELGVGDRVTIHNRRVEAMKRFDVGVVTARACAPLVRLFEWGERFAVPETTWLLPKGERVDAELADARLRFAFDADLVESRSDPRGRIVVARNVRRIDR